MVRLGPIVPSYNQTDLSRHSRREAQGHDPANASNETARTLDGRSFAGILERMIAR